MLFLSLIVFLLGLSLGSFANCLIWRLYKEEKIIGRSHCPLCGGLIAWYDNIPVLSFLWLKGRCRHCRANISWQYPVVELVMAALFLFFWFKQLNFTWLNISDLFIVLNSTSFYLELGFLYLVSFVLLVIFVFDLRYYLVSTLLVWPATLIFLILNIALGFSWYLILINMAGAGLFFLLQFVITRGKGIGEGDIWLGVLLGAIFPQIAHLVFAIFSAYIIGSLTGVSLILLGRKSWGSKLPLGVFLAFGAILTLILGEFINTLYYLLF
jgi:leader peptidase (prepilin peptidase) / N-methyltransferase